MAASGVNISWPQVTVAKWSDLEVLTELSMRSGAFKDLYAFRGQSVADYSLRPTLLRHVVRGGLSAEAALSLERFAVAEFQAQAHLHIDASLLPPINETLRWWGLMQHHRAATRLLDWSASPYVAAYFAVEDQWDSDGAIWYFDIRRLSDRMRTLYGGPSSIDAHEFDALYCQPHVAPRIVLRKPTHRSNRMVAQQGGFSFCGQILRDHAETIHEALSVVTATEASIPVYGRMVIPAHLKPEILDRLRVMNITAAALFPGVDGLGRSIDEFVRAGTQPK